MSCNLTYFIIILCSIVVGMLFGIIILPKYKYHGPNAKNEIQKKYIDKKNGKCFRFQVKSISCPQTIIQKIRNYFSQH